MAAPRIRIVRLREGDVVLPLNGSYPDDAYVVGMVGGDTMALRAGSASAFITHENMSEWRRATRVEIAPDTIYAGNQPVWVMTILAQDTGITYLQVGKYILHDYADPERAERARLEVLSGMVPLDIKEWRWNKTYRRYQWMTAAGEYSISRNTLDELALYLHHPSCNIDLIGVVRNEDEDIDGGVALLALTTAAAKDFSFWPVK